MLFPEGGKDMKTRLGLGRDEGFGQLNWGMGKEIKWESNCLY